MRQVKLQKKMNGPVEPVNGPSTNATTPGSPKTPGKMSTLINKAKQKAISLYNKSAGRTVSSVSKEFDGKEVQGKRVDVKRPGGFIPGGKSKEVYNMPGGGKRVEKEKYNMQGDVVSRKVKDTKINPSNASIRRENRIEKRIEKLKGKLN